MASAESLCHTETDPDFSILTIGTQNNCDSVTQVLDVPLVLPFLAQGKTTGVTLEGVTDLQKQYESRFGPGDYRPNLFVSYWAFRAMIGIPVDTGAVRPCGVVAHPAWTHTRVDVVRPVRAVDDPDAVPGQQRGLDLHRDGPPTLDRRTEPRPVISWSE